ncbi:MAG: ABC transporter permease [Acidobacteriota bacterium]|nr:ABC transporter permease [Acidobacteriota bacterium]
MTVALFAIVDSVLLAPSPFRGADRVFRVTQSFEYGVRPIGPEVTQGRDAFRDPAVVSFYAHAVPGATSDAEAGVRIIEYRVSPSFFETVGLEPLAGRRLHDDDAGNTVPRIVVAQSVLQSFGWHLGSLIDAPWRKGQRVEIVGVMADRAWFPFGANVWSVADPPGAFEIPSFVRLADGVDRTRLQARAPKFILTPVDDVYRPADRSVALLAMLLTSALCALLVAQLFAMAGADRARRVHDESIRRSVGATEAQIARRRSHATIVMALLASAAAAVVVAPAMRALVSIMPAEFFRHAPAALSWRTALMGAALALIGAGVYWRPVGFVGPVPGGALRPEAARSWVPRAQTGVMVAASVAIVYVTAVALANLISVQRADLGFVPEGVIEIRTSGAQAQEVDALVRELRATPGIERVGASLIRPLSVAAFRATLHVAGGNCPPRTVRTNYVSGDYFGTLGIRAIEGAFEGGSPAPGEAIVNRTLARQLRACNIDPLGQLVAATPTRGRIAAVVDDTPDREIGVAPDPLIYFATPPSLGRIMTVYARGGGAEALERIRSVAAATLPGLRPEQVKPLEAAVDHALRPHRARTLLLVTYGVTAAALALFGVAAQQVAALHLARKALAVKLALGAAPGLLRREVVRKASLEITAGASAGAAAGALINAQGAALFVQMPPVHFGLMALVAGTIGAIGVAVAALATAGIDDVSPVDVLKTV